MRLPFKSSYHRARLDVIFMDTQEVISEESMKREPDWESEGLSHRGVSKKPGVCS